MPTKKRAKQKLARDRKDAAIHRQNCREARGIVYQIHRIIVHFFPDLFAQMREIEDFRSKPQYELAEIITACIAMFLFKAEYCIGKSRF